MKVNLKKIGAIVAGATILASSVAFAGGLSFGNTVLVNDQGNTAAKVVVGEKAMASDGVAAANIAAQIAANAWKSTTFTASVSGEATCAAGAGDATGGACAISNEKAKLEITVPGSATPGTYNLKTLVADITDRTILDRGQGSLKVYNRSTSDTSLADAHPFVDGFTATGLSGVSNELLYRIDGNAFDPFKDVTITDSDSGRTYKESQYLFVRADAQYKDSFDTVGGRFKDFVYQIKFTHDQYGIPACTVSANGSWTSATGCSLTSTDATQNHKVKIKFLGSDWVITKLDSTSPGVGSSANETGLLSGGEVDLAKESVGGIINVGECLDAAGGLKVCLDDIKEGNTASEQSAIISIKDANGAVLKQTTVAPGTTQTISTTGGSQVRVRVFKTAPGYTFGAKWADMSVISNELKLKDGDIVESNANRDVNSKWKVRLAWKNRDTGSDNSSDHLRSILVYRDISDFFKSGEGYNLVEDPLGYKFVYKGLDLNPSSSDDFDTLRYEFIDLGSSGFTYAADGSTSTTRESNATGYMRITTDVSGGFTTSQGTGNEVRVLLLTSTTDSLLSNLSKSVGTGFSAIDGSGNTLNPGATLLKLQGTPERWVYLGNLTTYTANGANGAVVANDTYVNLQYSTAGAATTIGGGGLIRIGWGSAGSPDGGMHFNAVSGGANFSSAVSRMTNTSSGTANLNASISETGGLVIVLSEDAGEGQSASKPSAVGAFFNITAKSFNKDSPNARYAKDKCTVASVANFSSTDANHDLEGSSSMPTQREVNYITHRGTICKELSDSVFTLKVPKNKIVHPQFLLSTSDAASGTTSGYQATLAEGETYSVPGTGGVTVKLKEITEDVGACGVGTGAAPACTVDSSGVSAVVLADGKNPKASYEGATAGSVASNLVVLDRDASEVDVLVTVGGPAVNEVTKKALEGASVDFNTEKKVVKEVVSGKRIVVAGLTSSDTLDAAKDFIAQLKKQ